jgi:hypothetical protein
MDVGTRVKRRATGRTGEVVEAIRMVGAGLDDDGVYVYPVVWDQGGEGFYPAAELTVIADT